MIHSLRRFIELFVFLWLIAGSLVALCGLSWLCRISGRMLNPEKKAQDVATPAA
jgi:hypothetical protein